MNAHAPCREKRPTRFRDRGQLGGSLYLALVAMVLISILLITVSGFAATVNKAARPYLSNQQKKAAGDSALKAAINYVSRNTNLGRDASTYPADPTCGYRVPASITDSVDVTVTCDPIAGSDSGSPEESGKVPDQALLLLGRRYGELPTYSPCTGSTVDRFDSNAREYGLTLDPVALQNVSGTVKCVPNKGAIDDDTGFKVNGSIRSNSPVRVASTVRVPKADATCCDAVASPGKLTVTGTGSTVQAGTSPLFYLSPTVAPCTGKIRDGSDAALPCTALPLTTSSGGNSRATPTGITNDPFNPQEQIYADPAYDTTGSATTDWRDGRGSEWRQGTVNWTAPMVSFNGATPVALNSTTTISCAKNQNLIRFYPGLYQSAADLNRIFNNLDCARGLNRANRGVFWFGPAEDGTNGSPSTFSLDLLKAGSTAQQGVYTFDFRDTASGQACALLTNTNNRHRWCVYADATNDNGPVVIAGWPKGWDPSALIAAPANNTSSTVTTTLSSASTVDDLDSLSWTDINNAKTYGDGAVNALTGWAYYKPTSTTTVSIDRALTLQGFGAVGVVQSGGTISFTVRHQENRNNFLNNPQLILSTVDRGNAVDCGTFAVPKSVTNSSSNLPDAPQVNIVSTDATADPAVVAANGYTAANWAIKGAQLRNCFSNAERIANMKFKWQVQGDYWNMGTCNPPLGLHWLAPITCVGADHPTKPRVFLDGVQISVEVPTGGLFDAGAPLPGEYCDGTKPGSQFIFGGDSTVHLGTAAMQVCAGPAPSNPEAYQQIAVWGQPVNYLTKSGTGAKRVGKTGSASLVPTSSSTNVDYCGPVVFGFGCFVTPTWVNAGWGIKPNKQFTAPATPARRVYQEINAGRAVQTTTSVTYSGIGRVGDFSSALCDENDAIDREQNLCMDSSQQISRVVLKANYATDCDAVISNFCAPGAAKVDVEVGYGSTTVCGGPTLQGALPATSQLNWYSIDLTSMCGLNSASSFTWLNASNSWVKLKFNCSLCILNKKQVEGVELQVSLATPVNTNVITPTTGCLLSETGFGSGIGDSSAVTQANYVSATNGPDCARISGTAPVMSSDAVTVLRGGGRFSAQGTLYAPNDAMEISDGDIMYPFASRGLVARHLRVRAMRYRAGYSGASLSGDLDKTPFDRQVELTACARASADVVTDCGSLSGDLVLGRAGVRFTVDRNMPASPQADRLRVPILLWWNTELG